MSSSDLDALSQSNTKVVRDKAIRDFIRYVYIDKRFYAREPKKGKKEKKSKKKKKASSSEEEEEESEEVGVPSSAVLRYISAASL